MLFWHNAMSYESLVFTIRHAGKLGDSALISVAASSPVSREASCPFASQAHLGAATPRSDASPDFDLHDHILRRDVLLDDHPAGTRVGVLPPRKLT